MGKPIGVKRIVKLLPAKHAPAPIMAATYGRIAATHFVIQATVRKLQESDNELQESDDARGSPPRLFEVCAVDMFWSKFVAYHCERTDAITKGKQGEMAFCFPAGVVGVDTTYHTCRSRGICPHCNTREALDLNKALTYAYEDQGATHMSVLTFLVLARMDGRIFGDASYTHLRMYVNNLRHEIRAAGSRVITSPVYSQDENRWYIKCSIIVVDNHMTDLPDPAKHGINARWVHVQMTYKSIAETVANISKYPFQMLWQGNENGISTEEFVHFVKLKRNTPFRCRGIFRSLKTIEELSNDSRDQGKCIRWGPSPQGTDMEEQARYTV
jgi:hypothetical protein